MSNVRKKLEYTYYIFDFDNTLADTYRASLLTYRKVFEYFDWDFKESLVPTLMGESIDETFYRYSKSFSQYHEYISVFYKISDEVMEKEAVLFEDTYDFIHALCSKDKKMGIVTSKIKSTLNLLMDKFELNEYFSSVIAYEDVDKHKPKPDGILMCIKQLGAIKKKDCIYIGDSLNDKKAANAAGIDFIGIIRNDKSELDVRKETSENFYTLIELL